MSADRSSDMVLLPVVLSERPITLHTVGVFLREDDSILGSILVWPFVNNKNYV